MAKSGYVYIMTNKSRTTLYIGVTNNLVRRVCEHKKHLIKNSFTDRYNLEHCIYYEEYLYFGLAIAREKELKKWNRAKKEQLINKLNPEWKELVDKQGFVAPVIPTNGRSPKGLGEANLIALPTDQLQNPVFG